MIFLDKIHALRGKYDINDCEIQDTVILYGVKQNASLNAEHIIFSPMTEALMQILTSSYRGTIPPDLLTIYREMNGADLFYKTIYLKKIKMDFPFSYLSIYGVPLTNTRDRYEPYNISLEDTMSPEGTPMNWLKFGSYRKPDTSVRYDLFVDTDTGNVYAQEHDDLTCKIAESWESIDECLCSIFDLLSQSCLN